MSTHENTTMNNVGQFLAADAYAVVGASTDRAKYGNKVLRCYLQHHKKVYPVNPTEESIEGLACVKDVMALPNEVTSISIITPPQITEKIVAAAIKKGIKNIWMQPGAESDAAVNDCLKHQINIIAHGPCILVVLGFIEPRL